MYRMQTKTLLIFLGIALFYGSVAFTAVAQSANSSCVVTKVGAPADAPVLPGECSMGTGSSGSGGPRPTPPDYPTDLKQAIFNKFTITMTGFDNTHLKWTWEKLWDISNTNFIKLVTGAKITTTPPGAKFSRQVGCANAPVSVELSQIPNEAMFKYILTHELGHFIRWCNPRNVNKFNEHINAFDGEGAISWYGGHAASCSNGNNYSEDYADSVAYYMNPEAGLVAIKCGEPNSTPPNPFFKLDPPKQLHLDVFKQVF